MALAALLAGLLLSASATFAGGPLAVRVNGVPYVWSTAAPISYRTDNGPLSATVDETAARARVLGMFNVWQNVTTSSISYSRAGFVNPVGAFVSGDVDTIEEYSAVDGDCGNGNQSPVIYDTDASIFMALGLDQESIVGFAGPCRLSGAGQILAGGAAMNGLFQDGNNVTVPDVSPGLYDAAFIHEFGHFSGLDHSQINVDCASIFGCGADDLAGLPTMFPFLVDASQKVLSDDDIAWISRLYPQASGVTTFANSYGTITGTVFFSDGLSHAQGVNVIARRMDTIAGQDRTNAVSVVSGFKFTSNPGQSVTADYLPCTPASDCPPNGFFDDNSGGSFFGSRQSGDIGFFDIPVPSGFAYTVELETIDPGFDGGSSVGPLSPPIPMPGTAPAAVTTAVVNANTTLSVGNLVLTGTDPRFDQFEGP